MQGKALIGWLFNCVIMDQFKKTYCGQRINSCKYRQEFFFFKKVFIKPQLKELDYAAKKLHNSHPCPFISFLFLPNGNSFVKSPKIQES